MRLSALLIGILLILVQVNAVGQGNGELWAALTETRDTLKENYEYRVWLEENAYSFSRDLCYAYEFRKQHGIDLENPNFFKEDFFVRLHWLRDSRLRSAVFAWNILQLKAMGNSYNFKSPHNALFTAKSRYSANLPQTSSFVRAVKECSEKVGVNLYPIITSHMDKNDFNASVTANLTGGGFAAVLFRTAFKKLGKFALGKYANTIFKSRVFRWSFWSAMTGGVSYSAYNLFKLQEEQKELIQSANESEGMSLIPEGGDEWLLRKKRLYSFIVMYNDFFKGKDLQSNHVDIVQKINSDNKFNEEIAYWKENIKELREKRALLDRELSTIANLEEVLLSILDKKDRGVSLTEEEQQLFNDAQFLGVIDLTFKILEIRGGSKNVLN